MESLKIRAATSKDQQRIAEIIGDPGEEAIGLVGNRAAAARLGVAIAMMPGGPQGWERSTVAEERGSVVGVIQCGGDIPQFTITPRLVWLTLRTLGLPRMLGRIEAFRAMSRVQYPQPKGTYHIAELHVDPGQRGRGIGGSLLDWAEVNAREQGFEVMSLVTTTSNPARRLYERHGFVVAETKTDADYERYTGIKGRYLMLKRLK